MLRITSGKHIIKILVVFSLLFCCFEKKKSQRVNFSFISEIKNVATVIIPEIREGVISIYILVSPLSAQKVVKKVAHAYGIKHILTLIYNIF